MDSIFSADLWKSSCIIHSKNFAFFIDTQIQLWIVFHCISFELICPLQQAFEDSPHQHIARKYCI